MSTAVLNYPGGAKVTTGIALRVGELPLGVRTPATYTVTVGTGGSSVNVIVAADAAIGATTLTVGALTAAVPANSILSIGGQVVVTSAAAASSATSLTIYPANFTILNGTTFVYNPGTLTIGSRVIPVTALPALIDVGDTLLFNSTIPQTLTVTGRSPAGATQLRVNAITSALTAGNSASTKALYAVVGCTVSPVPSPTPKVVDTTNLLSGIGMEKVITAISQEMSVDFNIVRGDLGGGLLVEILRDKDKYNKEIYFQVTMDDGERHEGVAIITAGPETGSVQDLRKIQCKLQVQGQTYVYTKSTYAFY
ncbi:MAG: hypothetical protein KME42_14080 [Tildeniella nuda ZEHNDER 1965/U140]|jgi:hypothetical protein|nr:hypothetical protein [Tildeniella nuda ZEHNDER 1965/U140]